mmetsp:Transcript_18470/g.38454  ORF Transcript_18470/g.38454 Transcript_18470/m.38454 type:complete len:98 (-) Transcript_18470:156-449(-)
MKLVASLLIASLSLSLVSCEGRKLQQGNAFPLDIEGAFQTFFEEYFDSTVDGAGPAGAEDLFGEGFLLFGQGFSAALQQIWDGQLADLELLGPGPGK